MGNTLVNVSTNKVGDLIEAAEKKCAFFWRLDKIWGSHPSLTSIAPVETASSSNNNNFIETPSQTNTQNSTDSVELGADEWPDGDMGMGDTAEGEDNNEALSPQASDTTQQTQSTRTSRSSATCRGAKDLGLKDLLETNQKYRSEQNENRIKIDAETRVEIARIQADSMRHFAESNRLLFQQQMQRDKEREERQIERERENGKNQMAMLRMILESLKNQPRNS